MSGHQPCHFCFLVRAPSHPIWHHRKWTDLDGHALQATFRFLCIVLVSWLMSFKLLAVALQQGEVRKIRHPLLFLVAVALPIHPNPRPEPGKRVLPRQTASQSLVKLATGVTGVLILNPVIHGYVVSQQWNPPVALMILLECTPPPASCHTVTLLFTTRKGV